MRTRAGSKLIDPRSFDSILAAFLEELRARRYSSSLIEQTCRVLPRFFSHLKAHRVRDIRAVTEEHVFAYVRALGKEKTYKGTLFTLATQRSYLAQIQRLFFFLDRRSVILQNPALDLQMPKVSHLPKVILTELQARRLVSAPSPWDPVGQRNQAILETLYGTGIRVAECVNLELKDLDLAKGTLFVRQGKGKKDRVVPVAGRAVAALDRYLREGRPELVTDPRQQALFLASLHRPGHRISTATISRLVWQSARQAGITSPVSPHTLRHTYATHLIQGGADVRHVQKLLGHADLRSTAVYTRVAPNDLARAMKKAHPREKTWARRQKAIK